MATEDKMVATVVVKAVAFVVVVIEAAPLHETATLQHSCTLVTSV